MLKASYKQLIRNKEFVTRMYQNILDDRKKHKLKHAPHPPEITDEISVPPGFFSIEDRNVYRQMVGKIFNGTIVEVGTLYGRSISCIFNVCVLNKNKIYSVDKYHTPEFKIYLNGWGNGNLKVVGLITEKSAQASQRFKNESVDLVFIDGDHSYEAVRNDLLSWFPKIKKSGVIMGHDYTGIHEGVSKAVKKYLPNHHKPINSKTSVWWAVK
jgi:predicted O-methyltransferase YrrM